MDYRPADIAAVALTHAHFDHIGVARQLQEDLRVPIWLHREDFYIAAHPYRYAHENPRAPRVLFTPGHTYGHCAFHLPDRGVLFSGDALVTLDPYTGSRGPPDHRRSCHRG